MLILLSWLVLASLSFFLGILLLGLVGAPSVDRRGDRLMLSLWLGTSLLGPLLLAISLFTPLTPRVGAALLLILAAAAVSPLARGEIDRMRGAHLSHGAVPLLISAGAAALITFQVITSRDSITYHYDIAYLLSQVGVVPGLSLVHSRYGLLSSWFTLPAVFNHGAAVGRVAVVANGFCLSLVLLHCWLALRRIFDGSSRLADRFVLIALPATTFMPVLLNYTLSASPDFFTVILTVVVLWSMFLLSGERGGADETGRAGHTDENLIPLFLAAAAVTVKFASAPALAAAFLFLLVRRRFHLSAVLADIVVVLIILAPSLTARTVVSGCPLYPVPLCLDLSWSVGEETAEREIVPIIRARHATREGGYLTPRWLRRWLRKDSMNGVALTLFALSVLSLILLPFGGARPFGRGWFVVLLSGGGIAFLFATSPQMRFAWGYLTVIPAYWLGLRAGPFLRRGLPPRSARVAASAALATLRSTLAWVETEKTYPREPVAYKLRFLRRALRRLPLGREGLAYSLPRGGGPPVKLGRGGRASAALTLKLRPPSSCPSNSSIARAADSSSPNSTKAKPRGRPVLRSAGRKTSTISPADENSASISVGRVSKLRLPTKIFAVMTDSFLLTGPPSVATPSARLAELYVP